MRHKIQALVLMVGFITLPNCSDPKPTSRVVTSSDQQRASEELKQSESGDGTLDPAKPKKSIPTSSPVSPPSVKPPVQAPLGEAPAPGPEGESPEIPPTDPPPNGILALHQPAPTTCNQCHESKRPSLTHYKDHDCASCHKFPSFKGASFSHDPKPATCSGCHTPPAAGLRAYPNQGPPANFNAADPKALGGRHYAGKDCKECHQTPKEGAAKFVFTHSAPNPQVCLPCHFNNGAGEHQNGPTFMLTGFGNCTNCHRNFDVKVQRNFGRN